MTLKERKAAIGIAAFLIAAAFATALVINYVNNRGIALLSAEPKEPLIETSEQPDEAASTKPEPVAAVLPSPSTGTKPPLTAVQKPAIKTDFAKLIFVIDDAGNNLNELEPFLKLPFPLTVAVLPGLPYSAEAAKRIRAAGKEVFLHQPMESLGGSNPGPGAVYANMDEHEIRSIINKNLDEVWPVAGMNNHEGSKVTMDENLMEIILDICRQRKIVFLDSRTTSDTAAPAVAKRLGISIVERDIFLDNDRSRDSIKHYLDMGLQKADQFQKTEQYGKVVFIGHAWSPELAPLLSELYPDWKNTYSISTVSEFIKSER